MEDATDVAPIEATEKGKKDVEQRLRELEECCKENKIFIFKLIGSSEELRSKFEKESLRNFLLNNLDFYISNSKYIDEGYSSIYRFYSYLRNSEKTETIIDTINEDKLKKIIRFVIYEVYKGDIKTCIEQLQHPEMKVGRVKTYNIFTKIIEKIKKENEEDDNSSSDGKKKRSKRRSTRRSKRRSKRKMK